MRIQALYGVARFAANPPEFRMAEKIPVTVLTGYLGAGKTTLLNRILSEDHGQKFAVIVNEFGNIGIDNDLIVGADEEVFEMNNGCVCCTVRGDLIRIIEGLLKRRDKFDAILVETTGLCRPCPSGADFFCRCRYA
jgi:G3E family GTPase